MPIRQIGKRGREWIKTQRKFKKDNPPNHEGYVVCGPCGRYVKWIEATVDHIKPRGSYPHLVHEPSNLQYAHWECNSEKGSKH